MKTRASIKYFVDDCRFYSAEYFLQYINKSTTNKLINYYSNFLVVVHIVHSGKTGEAHRRSNH